jgi:hypothetical protein
MMTEAGTIVRRLFSCQSSNLIAFKTDKRACVCLIYASFNNALSGALLK